MTVRIRLKRAGSRHRPFYKIVVTDSRAPRDGAAIESLGHYDPLKEPEGILIDEERYNHWLSKGASASEPVKTLFRRVKKLARGETVEAGMEPLLKTPIMEAEEESAEVESGEAESTPAGEGPADSAPEVGGESGPEPEKEPGPQEENDKG